MNNKSYVKVNSGEMTHNELRFYRREWINNFLHINYKAGIINKAGRIKKLVRKMEWENYGKELKAYSEWWSR